MSGDPRSEMGPFGLPGGQLDVNGVLWAVTDTLNGNFSRLGYFTIGLFVASWILSIAASA